VVVVEVGIEPDIVGQPHDKHQVEVRDVLR
jgi:hypothetical protein